MVKRVTNSQKRLSEIYPVRSLWPYQKINNIPNILKEQVLLAKNKLQLDFGGFDILEKDGEYYFLECNSAVSLDAPYIISFFRDNLKKLLDKKFNYILNS